MSPIGRGGVTKIYELLFRERVKNLAERLETTPHDIKNYFSKRLDTLIDLEGNTLKVKGLLKLPVLNILLEEIRDTNK